MDPGPSSQKIETSAVNSDNASFHSNPGSLGKERLKSNLNIRKAKENKRVRFNDKVKVIMVESYKPYNSKKGDDEEQSCCKRIFCLLF